MPPRLPMLQCPGSLLHPALRQRCWAQLRSSPATSAAALRVMPLLLQPQPQLRADAAATPDGMPGEEVVFPDRLLSLATSLLPAVNELNVRLTPTAEGQAVAVEAQAEPLFLLHTVAVRFLHWLRALDEEQLVAMPVLGSWSM